MARYILEWTYGNLKTHSTYVNSLDMAKLKAEPLMENDKIVLITIVECKLVEILKNIG